MYNTPITGRNFDHNKFADRASERNAEIFAFGVLRSVMELPNTGMMTEALIFEVRLGFNKKASLDLAMSKYLKADPLPYAAWDAALKYCHMIQQKLIDAQIIPALCKTESQINICKYVTRYKKRIIKLCDSLYRIKHDIDDYRPYAD